MFSTTATTVSEITKEIKKDASICIDNLVFNAGNPDSVITTAILNQHLDHDVGLYPTHKQSKDDLSYVFCPNISTRKKGTVNVEFLMSELSSVTDDIHINSVLSVLSKTGHNEGLMLRLSLALSKLNMHHKVISTEEMALIWHNHNNAIKSLAKRSTYTPIDVFTQKEHIAQWGHNNISAISTIPAIKDYLKFIDDLKHRLNDMTVYEVPLITGKECIPVMYGDSFTSPFLIKLMLNVFDCALVVRVYGNHIYGDFQSRASSNITWRTVDKLFNGRIKNANQY